MYRLSMKSRRHTLLVAALAVCVAFLASCSSADEPEAVSATESAAATDAANNDEDHGDEDHGDEDHGDEDHGDEDHGDEDHGDEDHGDEDHGDEDHGDEDHGDEDHGDEDHGDEDHGDEDHGDEDHGDEDHGDEDHGDSGNLAAHVHGSAELLIGWTDGDVVIDLVSPADNIFGFEGEPATDEQLLAVKTGTESISEPGVIAINESAKCDLVEEPNVELTVDGSHSEVVTSWLFKCEDPSEIQELDATGLFHDFPRIVDIDAQWASETAQSAAELSPDSPVVRFE